MKKKIKLTKEQIQRVESYLNDRKVYYIDIRFEILDHIISDIEFLIENKNISFEVASKEVSEKWNKILKRSSSFWLGLGNYGPDILIKKCLKIYKPLFLKSILVILIVMAVAFGFKEKFNYSLASYKNDILLFISLGWLIYVGYIIYWYFRMKKGKVNSSYSFLFYKQIAPTIFSAIIFSPFINDNYFTKENEFSYLMLVMLLVFFTSFLNGRFLYKKHLEAVSKHILSLN